MADEIALGGKESAGRDKKALRKKEFDLNIMTSFLPFLFLGV